MLTVNNIEVVYNNYLFILKGFSLSVAEGKITALLGANGAGKSTALKAISGLLKSQNGKIQNGDIEFMGQSIAGKDPSEIVRSGITLVPEGRRVLEDMSVDDNLWVGACMRRDGKVREDYEKVMSLFPNLKRVKNRLSGYLSGGEQQMLALGRALMARPKLMMLDEPSLGLSPLLVREIFQILRKINQEEKTTILLVEQNAHIALNIASYGYIMENGKVVLDGPSEKLKENQDVREFYLGLSQSKRKKSFKNIKHYKRRKRWLS